MLVWTSCFLHTSTPPCQTPSPWSPSSQRCRCPGRRWSPRTLRSSPPPHLQVSVFRNSSSPPPGLSLTTRQTASQEVRAILNSILPSRWSGFSCSSTSSPSSYSSSPTQPPFPVSLPTFNTRLLSIWGGVRFRSRETHFKGPSSDTRIFCHIFAYLQNIFG